VLVRNRAFPPDFAHPSTLSGGCGSDFKNLTCSFRFRSNQTSSEVFDLKPTQTDEPRAQPPGEARIRFLGSFSDFAPFFPRNLGSFGFVFERQFSPFLTLIHL